MDDDAFSDIAAQHRARLGHAPPTVTDAASVAFRQRVTGLAWDVPRGLLVAAGVAGLALDLPVLLGTAIHTSQDVAVLHLALAVGFLVSAWRPDRYARGMTPVALVAALLLILPTATDRSIVITSGLAELSHMPVLVGAAALLLGGWPQPMRRLS